MGRFCGLLLCICLSAIGYGQVAMSMADATAKGINIAQLDQQYKPAVSPDSTKSAFAGHHKEFVTAYRQMLGDLGVYLSTNNFFWEKQTRFINRIYFKPDGHIDYYFYSFKDDDINAAKEKEFKRLMNQFIKTYKFTMSCNVAFSQSSPVTFLQNSDDKK